MARGGALGLADQARHGWVGEEGGGGGAGGNVIAYLQLVYVPRPSTSSSTRSASSTPLAMEEAHAPPGRKAGGSVDTPGRDDHRLRATTATTDEPATTGGDRDGDSDVDMATADPLRERRRRTGHTGTNSATLDARTSTQEDREADKLREQLRRRGIPIPPELLRDDQHQPQQHQQQRVQPPPPRAPAQQWPPLQQTQQRHQQQQSPQRHHHILQPPRTQQPPRTTGSALDPTNRLYATGSTGGGKGGGKGATTDGRVLLLTWKCSSSSCHAWSWPCRSRCHRCGAAKPSNPPRREDWWLESRLPPWAAEEAPRPHDVPGQRGPDGGGSRRVPGLPTRADLRRDASKGTGKGVTTTTTSAATTTAATARYDARHDPRVIAPGVLDPPAPTARDCDEGNLGDGDEDIGDELMSWAKVVRKGRRLDKARGGDRPPPGSSAPQQRDDDAPPPGPKPPALPPPLVVERPKAPRRAIASKRQAQLDRIERMEADGASPAKLQRAREGLQETERELRLAGGATERALSFSIKSADDAVEKARRALAKAKDDKRARLDLRESLDKALQEDDIRIERLEQRHKAALERRLYHVESKRAECVPERTIDEYRSAIAQLAIAVAADPTLAAVQSLLQRELDAMAPPQFDIDIAEGDTTSDTDPETDDETAQPSPAPPTAARHINPTNAGDRYVDQLAEARDRLERITAERRAAIESAEAHAARAAKRRLGEDGAKSQEVDGDELMSTVLTADRVKELYRQRLADAAEEVDHLTRMAAREEIPVLPPRPGDTQRTQLSPTQPNTYRRSRPPSPQRTPHPPKPVPQASLELARGADERMQELHEKVAAERREQLRLDRVGFQERMQRQQDAGGSKPCASRWGQVQQQTVRGRHPAVLRGKSEDGFIVSAARRRTDGDETSGRERSPRLRQADMPVA